MSYFGSQGDYWGERAVPTQEVQRNTTVSFGNNTVIPRRASVGTQSYSNDDFKGFSRDKQYELARYNNLLAQDNLPQRDRWDASMARRGGKTKKSYKKNKGKTRKSKKNKKHSKKTRKYKKRQ
jgi:hypothetical protein